MLLLAPPDTHTALASSHDQSIPHRAQLPQEPHRLGHANRPAAPEAPRSS